LLTRFSRGTIIETKPPESDAVKEITIYPVGRDAAHNKQSRPARSRPSPKLLAIAFGGAAVSDVISFWTTLMPPVQWALDLATALFLFLVLGRRWAILPGLVAEAIPGLGIFPVWILVVLSIAAYNDIAKRRRTSNAAWRRA